MSFDHIMSEAEAELGSAPGELAGTFPPGFAQQAGLMPDPRVAHLEDALYELVGVFLGDLERLGDLTGVDRGVLDDLHRAKDALDRVDVALTPKEDDD